MTGEQGKKRAERQKLRDEKRGEAEEEVIEEWKTGDG